MTWDSIRNGPDSRISNERGSDPQRLISPYAKRLAVQRGLRIADLVGTGPGGEIGAKDVRRAGAAVRRDADQPGAPTR